MSTILFFIKDICRAMTGQNYCTTDEFSSPQRETELLRVDVGRGEEGRWEGGDVAGWEAGLHA